MRRVYKTSKKERERALKWYRDHHEHSKKRMLAYRDRHHEELNKKSVDYYHLARLTVIMYYSDGTMACDCCGDDHYEFLTLEHINGGGTQHMKEVGHALAYWLINHNYPEGYRILCYNCNCARGTHGYCPHEKEKRNGSVASSVIA